MRPLQGPLGSPWQGIGVEVPRDNHDPLAGAWWRSHCDVPRALVGVVPVAAVRCTSGLVLAYTGHAMRWEVRGADEDGLEDSGCMYPNPHAVAPLALVLQDHLSDT